VRLGDQVQDHPHRLVDRCRDICRYENRPFALTRELLDRAWLYYFGAQAS